MISLTTQQIVTSFSQTQESDFAVGTTPGATVIAQEVQFQLQKLLEILHPEVVKLLHQPIIEEIVPITNIGTNQYQIQPTFTPTTLTLEYRFVQKNKKYYDCVDDSCFSNNETTNPWQQLGIPYVIISTDDLTRYDAEIRYTFDPDVAFTSLKSWLRDMVCCNLGSRIFPAIKADEWSIVKHYCSNVKMLYEKAGKLIPPELIRVNFSKPLFTQISWMRIARG